MEKEKICIFCGQKPGAFRSTNIICGGTYQSACKSCEKELKELDELEKCRRALRFGFAENPQKIEDYIAIVTEAETHRPVCPQCGEKMRFYAEEALDNSPLRDGLLSSTFDILPACCENCGRYEFYNPAFVRKNKFIAHLIKMDTGE